MVCGDSIWKGNCGRRLKLLTTSSLLFSCHLLDLPCYSTVRNINNICDHSICARLKIIASQPGLQSRNSVLIRAGYTGLVLDS